MIGTKYIVTRTITSTLDLGLPVYNYPSSTDSNIFCMTGIVHNNLYDITVEVRILIKAVVSE